MDRVREAKVEAVSRWLKNHVVPQDAYDGMTSFAMAESLLKLIDKTVIEQAEKMHEMSLEEAYRSVS